MNKVSITSKDITRVTTVTRKKPKKSKSSKTCGRDLKKCPSAASSCSQKSQSGCGPPEAACCPPEPCCASNPPEPGPHTIDEIRDQNICFFPGKLTKNPFFNYLREFRKCNCGLTVTEQAAQAGQKWRCMSDQEKAPYIVQAYKEQHPQSYKKCRD